MDFLRFCATKSWRRSGKRLRHEMRRAAGDVEKDSDKGEKNIEKPRIESQKVGPEEEDQPRPLAMNSLSRKKTTVWLVSNST